MTTAILFQSMPPLSPEEYAALEASIAANGVQIPVIVDEHGVTIDGHHRRRIAESLAVDCPTVVREGLTEAEKRTLALSLNVDRRHLSREQRRELISASLRADPELSSREHARRTGADHKTVESIRDALESTGEIPQSETRVSADGRERPASQPEREPEPDAAPMSDVEFTDDEPALTDEECEALADPGDLDEPEPERITGMDGKSYPKPSPQLPRSNRRPITEAFRDAAYDLGKRVITLTNLAADDRFNRNADQLAERNLSDLIRTRDALQRVIDQLSN